MVADLDVFPRIVRLVFLAGVVLFVALVLLVLLAGIFGN